MAGAGLRLSELCAGEEELACPVPRERRDKPPLQDPHQNRRAKARHYERLYPETVGAIPSLQKYFATQRGEGQSKNTPGPFSCLGKMPKLPTRRGC
jgi:hypothetical protein